MMSPFRRRTDRQTSRRIHRRALRCEPLEFRRLLAAGTESVIGPIDLQDQIILDVSLTAPEAEPVNRILVPVRVSGPKFMPGDGMPTAILFRAEMDSELFVAPVGRAPINEQVTLLDDDLETVVDSAPGAVLRSNLVAGKNYAMIFHGSDEELQYEVIFGSGALAATGAVDTNLFQPEDVNANGAFSPLDALLVINELARVNEGEMTSHADGIYTDVNADGEVSISDALRVMTLLGVQQEQGENFRPVPVIPEIDDSELEGELPWEALQPSRLV